MATRNAGLFSGLLATILGTAGAVGCGDDGATAEGRNGGAPNAGSTGKGGGGTASGGSSKGGMMASAGEGGGPNIAPAQGGAGGMEADGTAGAGGPSGGAGEAGHTPITKLATNIYNQASDLRGLFFTEAGQLYASGHLGIDNTVDRLTIVARFNADGTPDTTFGSGGFLQLNLAPRVMADTVVVSDGNEESLGIVELDNGDLVVQANVRDENGKGMDVVLARITPAGELVGSFGLNGVQRLVFGWEPAVDDASWMGTGGPVDTGGALELDESSAEQKLVVAGFGTAPKGQLSGEPAAQRTDPDRYIVRVSAETGAVDPEFNAGKVFTYNSGGTFADNARRVLVEADGSIVSAGYANFGAGFGNYIVAIRLTPAGLLDTSFGFGIVNRGVLRSNPFVDDGGVAECYAIARQSNGRYVTTGYGLATAPNGTSSYGYAPATAQDLISIGFTSSGTAVDQSFGIRGTRVIQSEELVGLSSSEDRGRDVLVLDDDRIVHAGRLGPNPALFVVEPDGGYDTAIDVGQVFTYEPLGATLDPVVPTSHFYRVVLSKDGKRIAATTNNHVEGVLLAVLQVGDP